MGWLNKYDDENKSVQVPEVTVYATRDKLTNNQLNTFSSKDQNYTGIPAIDRFNIDKYEDIWKSWIESGKPKINLFPTKENNRAYYIPSKNAMTINKGDIGDYFAELSHARQKVTGNLNITDWIKYNTQEEYDRYAYTDPLAKEFNAHSVIEPELYSKYFKRSVLTDEEINRISKDNSDPTEELKYGLTYEDREKISKARTKNFKKDNNLEKGGELKKVFNPNLAKKDLAFQDWYKQNTLEGRNLIPYDENQSYDYYSFYRNKDNENINYSIDQHFPDTYKRPNHPTFSNESIYSTPERPGGSWNGEIFNPKGKFKYVDGEELSKEELNKKIQQDRNSPEWYAKSSGQTDVTMSPWEYLIALPENAIADAAISIGSKLIRPLTKMVGSNIGKLIPKKFTSNPEAYYRMIGDINGFNDVKNSGIIRPEQSGIFANRKAYYTKGVPNDIKNPIITGSAKKGTYYKGPYMAEVNPGINNPMIENNLSNWDFGATSPKNHISITDDNVKLYKENWLTGYKEVSKKENGGEITTSGKVRDFLHKTIGVPMAINQLGYDVSGGQSPITENSLTDEELNYLRKVVRTNLSGNGMYGENGKTKIQYGDFHEANNVADLSEALKVFNDVPTNMKYLLGRANININNKDTTIVDRYNFNNAEYYKDRTFSDYISDAKVFGLKDPYNQARLLGSYLGSDEQHGSPVNIKINQKENGGELIKLDQLITFDNYNKPQPGGWLQKYSK